MVISRIAFSPSPSTGASLSRTPPRPHPPGASASSARKPRRSGPCARPRARGRAASACGRWPAAGVRRASRASPGRSRCAASARVDQLLDPGPRAPRARSVGEPRARSRASAPRSSAPRLVQRLAGVAQHPPRVALGGAGAAAEHHQRVERRPDQRRGEHAVAAPPRRAGWRAPAGRRRGRRPGDATSSRARRSRRWAGRAPRARARRRACRWWRASARRSPPAPRPRPRARRTRPASAAASASRHGAASPSSSQSAPLSTTSSSTRGLVGRPVLGARRPARSARKLSPSSARERPVQGREDLGARAEVGLQRRARARRPPSRAPRRSNSSTSAWRKP